MRMRLRTLRVCVLVWILCVWKMRVGSFPVRVHVMLCVWTLRALLHCIAACNDARGAWRGLVAGSAATLCGGVSGNLSGGAGE